MTPGRLALDLWMAGVALSLVSIGLFVVFWAAMSLLTVTRSRRRPRDLGQLSRWYPVAELADIDEVLDRILAEEHCARILAEEHGSLSAQRKE